MKFRRIRGEYWFEASDRTTIVIEKVTPATVIIDGATAVKQPARAVGPGAEKARVLLDHLRSSTVPPA